MRHQKVLRETARASAIPFTQSNIFPGFGPHPGAEGIDVAITVADEDLRAIVEKVVRGLTYALDGRYIEETHSVEVYFRHPEDAVLFSISNALTKAGNQHHRGPGILVTRVAARDDPVSGLFQLEIWGRFKAWATVLPS